MNERHAVVFEAGDTTVMTEKLDSATGKPVLVFSSTAHLCALYQNKLVEVGRRKNGEPIWRPLGDAWLKHKCRRQYLGGLAFLPGRVAPADTFNLWRGFSIEPRPGEWPLLHRHLLDIICSGSTSLCDWLLNWCAQMFQQPMVKAEVAVVLRGGEGCGKGTLGRALCDIMGKHGIQVFNPKHVVGNFNGHLRDVLLLFADEAFFAGDKAADGVLKGLITEPSLMIERKGVDAVRAPNLLRVIMATNARWAVPAAMDARRYLVLDVPDTVKGNREYFSGLNAEMEAGGLAAFLHDLLQRNIAGWDHRTGPTTTGLIEQKLLSLHGVPRWWFERLYDVDDPAEWDPDARIAWEEFAEPDTENMYFPDVKKHNLYESYCMWVEKQRAEYRPELEVTFWKQLRSLVPTMKEFRPRQKTGARPLTVRFPSLPELRAFFEIVIGGPINWPAASDAGGHEDE